PDHFYLTRSLHHLDLHSFPTRRSSDLVTDGNADPLPGASILIKGTTIGTTTDADGRYTIDVPSGDAVLVFSFIGYVSQEIPVGQDRKSTRLNSSHVKISYAVFCLRKKK